MHYFDPERPRFANGWPMYVSSSGRGIAPLYGLDVKPIEHPEDITDLRRRGDFVDPGDVLYISQFWCYDGHVATCYSLELGKYDFADWWTAWLNDPEKIMREKFRNGRGEGWSWKPHEPGPAAAPKNKPSAGAGAGKISINLDELF